MAKIVTYQGPRDRYYVTDQNQVRIYFPRNEGVEVSDELAAQIGTRDGRFSIEDPPTGQDAGGAEPDSPLEAPDTGEQKPRSRGRTKSDQTSEENK